MFFLIYEFSSWHRLMELFRLQRATLPLGADDLLEEFSCARLFGKVHQKAINYDFPFPPARAEQASKWIFSVER
jgi:hypothetical protein